jgi:putative hemolysin
MTSFLIVLLIVLLVLSAYFSSSETALYSLRHTILEQWRRNGNRQQQRAARLMHDHHGTLIAILLGTNFVNILAAVIFARLTYEIAGSTGAYSTLIAGITATAVILLFGEVLPKTFAYARAETLAPTIAPGIQLISKVFAPVIMVIRKITSSLLEFQGAADSNAITPEEYETFIDASKHAGVIEQDAADLLNEIMQLRSIAAVNVMIPRLDVQTVDSSADEATIIGLIRKYRHRRIPVIDGDLDNLVGVMDVKTYMMSAPAVRRHWLRTCLRKPIFVPEQAKLNMVLSQLRAQNQGMCFVVDEYGGISGHLTVEDILEELVGEMSDEYDSQASEIARIRPGHWRLNGLLQLHDLQENVTIDLPETTSETVTGFITEQLERIPAVGDELQLGPYQFVIRTVHQRRVLEVDLYKKTESDAL